MVFLAFISVKFETSNLILPEEGDNKSVGWTRSGRVQEETRKSNIWGAGRGEDGVRAEGNESDDEKVGDSKGIGGKNGWWDRECEQPKKEAVGKSVERMEEEQDRQKQIPRSEKKIQRKM
jgi:hypothetical protein